MKRFKPSTKIEVRPSKGKGRGVYTKVAVRRGEVLESAPVLLVPSSQGDDLLGTFLSHYMFQTDDGRRHVIGLGFASLINHGPNANAEFYVSSDRVVIKARRAIAARVEVTIDYGWTEEEWPLAGIALKDR